MNKLLFSLALVLASGFLAPKTAAQPSDYKHDLVNCRYQNGSAMDQIDCQMVRKYFATEADKKARTDAAIAKELAALEGDRLIRQAAEDKRKADWAAMRERSDLEQSARRAAMEQQRVAEDKAQATADRRAATAVDTQKTKCGADYKAPRIGMSIDRVSACVTTVKLKGQLNRADGVVSTYEGGNAYFHVMDGKIVSWGKY
jgi:hypothetical protein